VILSPVLYQDLWRQKTSVPKLPYSTDHNKTSSIILTQYQNVTDGWTDRQTGRHAIAVSCSDAWQQ